MVDDPLVSKKHIRIYPIIYDQDNPDQIAPLIYAQDISLNGTLWNNHRIHKKTNGVLLSDGDTLRVCDHITFTFRGLKEDPNSLSEVQTAETRARYPHHVLHDTQRLSLMLTHRRRFKMSS